MTKKIYNFIALFLLLLCANLAHAHDNSIDNNNTQDEYEAAEASNAHTNVQIHFRVNKSRIDLKYMNNAETIKQFEYFIDSVGVANIDSVVIIAQSSPEGSYKRNIQLAQERANSMCQYITTNYPDLANRVHSHLKGESWDDLRNFIAQDTVMSEEMRNKALDIIDADVKVETKKWNMKQLPTYQYLLSTYYPHLRNSATSVLYYKCREPQQMPIIAKAPRITTDEISQTSTQAIAHIDELNCDAWTRHLYLKTNAIGWAMGASNIGAEIDLAKHWSLAIPVYYSGWNYFVQTIKFRTLGTQPEVRYWIDEDNQGFFAGAHLGIASYNIAANGDYRYQDHNGESPAWGGGLSVGYRMPLSQDEKWHVEFSLGAGVYSAYYDKFHNTPDTSMGLLVETVNKVYWGLDQAAVSFSYRFDLMKKGGKR